MIPVRVPADLKPYIVRDDCMISESHELYGTPCPVCDEPLGWLNLPVALVAVGIMTVDRKASGWTTGGAVAVHTECARPPKQSGEASR